MNRGLQEHEPPRLVVERQAPKPGDKYDQGKARYDLLPFKALEEVVLVLTFGANKYKADGWREVENWRWRYFAAAMRHLMAWFAKGEARDPESGLHHLAHAACCILFMLELDA
jgi:dATP/dGTP diphosphohydrolase